jgi:hypothetical protein
MQGTLQCVEDNVYGYICNRLPLPWQGPDASIDEVYLFYVFQNNVWISGPTARQMCNGKRSDSKCPVKGIIVPELHKSSVWINAKTDLPVIWNYYNRRGGRVPDFEKFVAEVAGSPPLKPLEESLTKDFLQTLLDRVHSLIDIEAILNEIKPRLEKMVPKVIFFL